MKNYFLVLFLLFTSGYCSYGQNFHFSFTTGLNQSNKQQTIFREPFFSGTNMGVFAHYKLKTNWHLSGGIQYSQKGYIFRYSTTITSAHRGTVSMDYVMFPLNVNYHMPLGEKFSWHLSAGIFQGVLVQKDLQVVPQVEIDLSKFPLYDHSNAYDAGLLIGAGLGYQLTRQWKIGAEYQLQPSLTALSGPLFSFRHRSAKQLNASLSMSIYYFPFE